MGEEVVTWQQFHRRIQFTVHENYNGENVLLNTMDEYDLNL